MATMAGDIRIRLDKAGVWLIAGVSLSVLIAACLYLYLVRTIVQPLQTAIRLHNRLAVGDGAESVPSSQLERGDEVGDLFRAFQDATARQSEEVRLADDMTAGDFSAPETKREPTGRVRQAIRRMARATGDALAHIGTQVELLTAGCESIAAASGKLSATSDNATAATKEISTCVGQIRTHANQNAGLAREAERLTKTSCQSVDRGYEDIGEMGEVMLNMQAVGDKIVGIAKFIGDIAFQTNLLALNARVEAARAGQHGKGFTIVAEEVRNLAARSSQAAQETSTLMKETVEQVELAAAIAGRINATFVDIENNIQEAGALIGRIATASGEQSGDIDHISTALGRMDQSTRENTNQVGEVAERAGVLVAATGRLRQALRRFKLVHNRADGNGVTPRSGPRRQGQGENDDAVRKTDSLPLL